MRLKSFTAPSMAEAMEMVRQSLGDDAIIVSTQRINSGQNVRVTAALEHAEAEPEPTFSEVPFAAGAEVDPTHASHTVRDILTRHAVPSRLLDRLVSVAALSDLGDPALACAAALEANFTFAPLPDYGLSRPFMMVGPPGSGKSIAVAKLAARAVLKHRRVSVITCDNVRAGAVEQLAAFTRILDINLVRARGADSLRRAVDAASEVFDLVLVDSPGLNPFQTADMDYLYSMVDETGVEAILVLAAGGDVDETAEIADAFALVGTTRLLATRLDVTHRLGSVLGAADSARLALCDVTSSSHVANGLSPLNAIALARLLAGSSAIGAASSEP